MAWREPQHGGRCMLCVCVLGSGEVGVCYTKVTGCKLAGVLIAGLSDCCFSFLRPLNLHPPVPSPGRQVQSWRPIRFNAVAHPAKNVLVSALLPRYVTPMYMY